jgi:hypothetical protein
MAKIFKNESDLRTFLLKKCKSALVKTQTEVYQIINNWLEAYYADYTPNPDKGGYERTKQLLHSCVKSDIVQTDNGFKAEVYFKDYRYNTGKKPTSEQVVNTAAQGLHGVADGDGWLYVAGDNYLSIWDDYLQADAIDMLLNELRAQGIPIK